MSLQLAFFRNQYVRFGVCLPMDATFDLYTYSPYWMPHKRNWHAVTSLAALDSTVNDGKKYFHDKTTGYVTFTLFYFIYLFCTYHVRSYMQYPSKYIRGGDFLLYIYCLINTEDITMKSKLKISLFQTHCFKK